MIALISLFCRAYIQVALVALNVRHISHGRYLPAFLTGFGISAVWYWNANTASHTFGPIPLLVYALGAGLGTVTGMYLGRIRKTPSQTL